MGRGAATACGAAPEDMCETSRSACAIATAKLGVLASLYPVRVDKAIGHVGMQPCAQQHSVQAMQIMRDNATGRDGCMKFANRLRLFKKPPGAGGRRSARRPPSATAATAAKRPPPALQSPAIGIRDS